MRARTPCITVKSSCYFSLLCGDSVWRSVHFRSASLHSLSFCSARRLSGLERRRFISSKPHTSDMIQVGYSASSMHNEQY